jgi:hypothetical protein
VILVEQMFLLVLTVLLMGDHLVAPLRGLSRLLDLGSFDFAIEDLSLSPLIILRLRLRLLKTASRQRDALLEKTLSQWI